MPRLAFPRQLCGRQLRAPRAGKNLQALLNAHASVVATHPEARAVIIGDGPERSALEDLTTSLRIHDSVTFAGYRSDVRAVMPAFDVYANTSRYEGVSLTILEAMAAELPVVATRNGGNPEVVVDGETGFLTGDAPPQIAAALLQLAGDVRRRQAMGDAGRTRLEQYFSLTRMVEQYAAAYRGVPLAGNIAAPSAAAAEGR